MLKPGTLQREHWFFGPVRRCKHIYVQVMMASVLVNIFALASSLYIMTVYDRVIPNNAIDSLYALTGIVLVVIIFDFVMKIVRGAFIDRASGRIDKIVSTELFDKISRHDTSLNKKNTGALANMVRDFDLLKEVIGSASFTVFVDLPFIVLFLFVLYAIGGPVAAVPAMIVPAVILFSLMLQPIIKRVSHMSAEQGRTKQAVIVEMIGALETVKTTQGNSMLRNRWLHSVMLHARGWAKGKLTSQLASNFAQMGQQLSQIGIVVYGVFLISDGSLTMGKLIACVILSGRTMAPLGQIIGLLGRVNQASAAYKGLNGILNSTTDEEERQDMVKREVMSGLVELKNLTFTYEGQASSALHDINLTINPGERVAVLGPVGCGKTTLLRMICGLYQPDRGHVLLDNADIRQVRAEDVRRNIGVLLQNPVLFSGTIRENLLMGNPDATDKELIEAAKLTGADKFIGTLPGGFDFKLSERGRELSVGMRQTIAISRALISDPSLLILDEPTAPLDKLSETELVKKLNTATQGNTCIFVTHRGAMLSLADRIVLMDSGQIVLDGPKKEVLQKLNIGA